MKTKTKTKTKKRAQKNRKHKKPSRSGNRFAPVGWFASNAFVGLCEGDALLVTGSKRTLRQHARELGGSWQFAPTSFAEILRGMQRGGAYAFDEAAYEAFLPPAQQAGLDVKPEEFSVPGSQTKHFLRIQLATT